MKKLLASTLALGIALGAGAAHAGQLEPEQEEGLIKMAAQLTEVAEICQHYSPAEITRMRAEQRKETLALGVPVARYDSLYAANAAEARKRMNGISPAQRKSTCDQMKAMAAMGAGMQQPR